MELNICQAHLLFKVMKLNYIELRGTVHAEGQPLEFLFQGQAQSGSLY